MLLATLLPSTIVCVHQDIMKIKRELDQEEYVLLVGSLPVPHVCRLFHVCRSFFSVAIDGFRHFWKEEHKGEEEAMVENGQHFHCYSAASACHSCSLSGGFLSFAAKDPAHTLEFGEMSKPRTMYPKVRFTLCSCLLLACLSRCSAPRCSCRGERAACT